jgi:hypothetical protein
VEYKLNTELAKASTQNGLLEPIVPDYNKSVASAYLEANKHGYHGPLGLGYPALAELHGTGRMQGLPSWAIDYTQKKTEAFLHIWIEHKTFYTAGSRDPIVHFFDLEANCLGLEGAFINLVEKCAPTDWGKAVSTKHAGFI